MTPANSEVCEACPYADMLRRHSTLLDGSGDLDRPGLVVRLDRVERIAKALVWITGSLATASIGAAFALLVAAVKG